MIPGQIEKNLLILLDPTSETRAFEWHFVAWQKKWPIASRSEEEVSVRTVYCFERRDIVGYFLFRWYMKIKGKKGEMWGIYYLNEGLLSSLFNSNSKVAYRAFSADHLPRPKNFRQWLISLLPILIRAEKRYVVIGKKHRPINSSSDPIVSNLEATDFMFFSNASGKLLMTQSETLVSGEGLVFKSTANQDYAEVMEKEFQTRRGIDAVQAMPFNLPSIGKRMQRGDRTFFTEEYVKGKTLREVLHRLSQKNDIEGICLFLDRLEEWFLLYSSFFQGDLIPLSCCYEHLFNAFDNLYGQAPETRAILEKAREIFAALSRKQDGIVPIIAHNDLWPGNFIVSKEKLVAIDWERATPNRAPFFDFYWMILSAVLEYHVCRIGVIDYSKGIRVFLEGQDTVSNYGLEKLTTYLERHSIDKAYRPDFLHLFLMEWSVQGYLAIGSQTAMDRLAFGELMNFSAKYLDKTESRKNERLLKI